MAKKTKLQVKTEVNEALLNDLLLLYTTAEEEMLKKVAKHMEKGTTAKGWAETKTNDISVLRQEVSALLKSPSKMAKNILGSSILKAYKDGINGVEKETGEPPTSMSKLNVPLHIQNLILSNYNLIDDAHSKILRNVDDAYRTYQAEAASLLLSGTETRIQASQHLMNTLANKGLVTFVDKAGRTWDMGSYAEMAMRTVSAHAALQGRIDTQEKLGNDLMVVSQIGATCPICAKWQGVVLSISGKTAGYHTLEEAKTAGLFHPNCRHTITMWDVELDGEGKKELNLPEETKLIVAKYDATQVQHGNERMIRYWKRRTAAAITPKEKLIAQTKVQHWQIKNIQHCEKYGIRRLFQRESVKNPNSDNEQFMQWFGKHLMGYSEEQLAKIVLDEDTIKTLLKNKTESLTTLYKKYISENPSQDFKGDAETSLTYAQWLKAKVMELSVDKPDPAEVQYITIPAKLTDEQLKVEKKALSLTDIYKKYIGPNPSPDYKSTYKGSLTYAQWLKAQVGDLTLEKVIPVSDIQQGQHEIGIATAETKQPKIKKVKSEEAIPISENIKDFIKIAFDKMDKMDLYNDTQLETDYKSIIQGFEMANSSLKSEMNKNGQSAVIKNGKIYFNPSKAKTITLSDVEHEIGHLITKYGMKLSDAFAKEAADELLTELNFNTFSDMAEKVSIYAKTSPTEFFAEVFSEYQSGIVTNKVVNAAMKKMYFKQAKAESKTKTPIPTQEEQNNFELGLEYLEKEINNDTFGNVAAKKGFAKMLGYANFFDDDNIEAWKLLKNDVDVEFANKGKLPIQDDYANKVKSIYINKNINEILKYKKGSAFYTKAAETKTLSQDEVNFNSGLKTIEEKIANSGALGFGSAKYVFAQMLGFDTADDKFNKAWLLLKKDVYSAKSVQGNALVGGNDIIEKIKSFYDKKDLKEVLKYKEGTAEYNAVQQEAINKAQQQAEIANKVKQPESSQKIATDKKAYSFGFGSMSENDVSNFVQEYKAGHNSGNSNLGKEQAKRLAKQQKDYIKTQFDINLSDKNSSDIIKSFGSDINFDNLSDKKAPIYALYDYTKASGAYNWYKRGINRGRIVSISDHPQGRGLTEYNYGQKFSKQLDRYFDTMPVLNEDVYVHRVFGRDALDSLFGLETEKSKNDISVDTLISYAKKNAGKITIRDKSYLSTSLFTEGSWNGECELKIKVNKGTKAAFAQPVEAHPVDEVVLKSDQKLRIDIVYDRNDYDIAAWNELAKKVGFDANRPLIIYTETIPEDINKAVIEDKVKQIDEAYKNTIGGSARTALQATLSSEFKRITKTWTESERQAVSSYTGSSYGPMNRALRTKDADSAYKDKIYQAKSALDKAATSEDRVYRRGSDFKSLEGMLGIETGTYNLDDFKKQLKNNSEEFNSGTRVVYDLGFVSTSPLATGGFSGQVEYRIMAPKGSKAVYVDPLSMNQGELETIFQSGTKFRIIKIEDTANPKFDKNKIEQGSPELIVYMEAMLD